MNDEQRTKLEANVTDWLKDHVYTELTNANGVEVWRCKQPGSNNLAFDICVTRYGTAVFGDIGHLTFDIDASYGIHYLANTGYSNLHGKLAASCKEEWIDLDAILDTVRDCICTVLDDEEVEYPGGMDIKSLIGWLGAMAKNREESDLPFEEWAELLDRVGRFDEGTSRDIVPAFDLLAESEELLRTSDLWESTFSKPSDHVWRKIFYVQHAATAIMAQKAVAKPIPEQWDGQGVPPAKTICDLQNGVGEWRTVEITAVGRNHILFVLSGNDVETNQERWIEKNAKFRLAQQHISPLMEQLAEPMASSGPEYCYSMGPTDEQWNDDGLAEYVSDRELTEGTVIQRGVVDRSQAHSFLPDANAVLEYMAERAGDENSEYCDGFPNITKEQEATLLPLLEPLKAWADRNCEVNFYTVPTETIEPYTVTAEDVAAGEVYRASLETGVPA